MLFQIIATLAAGLAIFTASYVAYIAIACRIARWKFQKISRGIPMPDGLDLLGNGSLYWSIKESANWYLWKRSREMKGKTYGSLYGTTPIAWTVDLDIVNKIRTEPQKHIWRMPTLNLPAADVEKSIFLIRGEDWRRVRDSFAPALKTSKYMKPNTVQEVEASIDKLVGLIDSKLEDKSKLGPDGGRVVEIDDLLHRYTLDHYFSSLYKQDTEINFDERPCKWVEMTEEGVKAFQQSPVIRACLIFPILAPIVEWLIWNFHPQGLWRKKILRFMQRQTRLGVEARKEARELIAKGQRFDPDNFTLKDGTQFRRNLLDSAIDNFLDGQITKKDLFGTSFFLFNAANKTTCDCVMHTLYHIAANTQAQERLRKSILEEGEESEYLEWVLNESLRLYPPVSGGCSRTLGEDIEVEGGKYLLPKGTFVITPLFVIHRLPEYWGDDSEEFVPERWRDTSHHNPNQYLPFGAGLRICPGKDFAMFAMKKLFVALMTRYRFHTTKKEDLYHFDSPFFFICMQKTPTYVTIRKLVPDHEAA